MNPYSIVPKTLAANLAFRRDVLRAGYADRDVAEELWIASKRDILFYVNTFCWTFNPKEHPEQPVRPFITYGYQDVMLRELTQSLGRDDIAVPKSRDMGASWCCLFVLEWRWHFYEHQSFLLTSEKEELVDTPGNHKALFQKLDQLHEWQPVWLLPTGRKAGKGRTKKHLRNVDTGSAFDGEATVANMGTGDRRTAVLLDEASKMAQAREISVAMRDVTRCRIYNSSPLGQSGTGAEFYRRVQNPNTKIVHAAHPLCERKGVHWSAHPEKARGLYTVENGKVRLLDEGYWIAHEPDEYPFVKDGRWKLRSPWFDEQCRRSNSDAEIAQELEIDFGGSDFPIIDEARLQAYVNEFCRPVEQVLWFDYDRRTREPRLMNPREGIPLSCWMNFDDQSRPRPDRRFGMGIDISMGTGSSESVISVGDLFSGEKVAEYADSTMPSHRFAELAVAIAKWFNGAFMIWEGQGPGENFTRVVVEECGYGNIYFRTAETRLSKKISDTPGFYHGGDSKKNLLTSYRDAIVDRSFINPSEPATKQLGDYIVLQNGRIEHRSQTYTEDPTDIGPNHGDRVIADALLCKIMRDRGAFKVDPPKLKEQAPVGSLAWRRAERRREAANEREAVWA